MSQGEFQLWEKLFSPPAAAESCRTFPMRLLRRGGHPFLLVPNSSRLAAKGLDLYAPQTTLARCVTGTLRFLLRLGWVGGLEKTELHISEEDSFVAYLNQEARTTQAQFALLLGNPNVRGQRCIFLLFDAHGDAAAVIKAGVGTEAQALVAHEEAFLKNVPSETPGVPHLRSVFGSERVRALALDFFGGAAASKNDWGSAGKLLSAWIDPNRVVALAELPVWNRLLISAGEQLPKRVRELGAAKFCSTLFHGDFAPWNVRVNHGSWTLVDWERGELAGPPLWDLVHFVIQPAILVNKARPQSIVHRLSELFRTPVFVQYAARAKVQGLEWLLVQAYLEYCVYVIRQTEGLNGIRALAQSQAFAEMTN